MDPFLQNLLQHTMDGVAIVDPQRRIRAWNQTLEKMTGMLARDMDREPFDYDQIGLADAHGAPLAQRVDPLDECLRSGKTGYGDFTLTGISGRVLKVRITFSPVFDANQQPLGALLVLHDASAQLELQRQLKDLYEFSMLDPLTQVANRAEFERALEEFVRTKVNHNGAECSLIIADIDHFKQINDNFNHHIGDQALIAFSDLLKRHVRSGDVIARYGGEEFVILCTDCDLATALERAEEIRAALERTPQRMLLGKCLTASFGVSQLEPPDDSTNLFLRADTALLRAKEMGRNRVEFELAPHAQPTEHLTQMATQRSGPQWPEFSRPPLAIQQYRTRTPVPVLVEKLRGYIAETEAELQVVHPTYASLLLEIEDQNSAQRKGWFEVQIDFQDVEEDEQGSRFGRRRYTYLRVSVHEGKRRWFATNTLDLAPGVLLELERFFMFTKEENLLMHGNPRSSR